MRAYNEKNFMRIGYRFATLSIVISLLIYILPWDTLKIFLPDLALLTTLFLIRHSPKQYGLFWAFSIGLIQDLLLFMPLGFNALIFLCSATICLTFFLRPYQISNIQEVILVFILLLLSKAIYLIMLEVILIGPTYSQVLFPMTISLLASVALWMIMHMAISSYHNDD